MLTVAAGEDRLVLVRLLRSERRNRRPAGHLVVVGAAGTRICRLATLHRRSFVCHRCVAAAAHRNTGMQQWPMCTAVWTPTNVWWDVRRCAALLIKGGDACQEVVTRTRRSVGQVSHLVDLFGCDQRHTSALCHRHPRPRESLREGGGWRRMRLRLRCTCAV